MKTRSCFFFLLLHLPLVGYELSIGAIFQDEAPYLKEWIEYHRMVGVEHFWLYNDASQDCWRFVLQPYIDEGVVDVIDRLTDNSLSPSERQMAAYRDALTKAKGQSVWLALIDVDEFILPRYDKTVSECLSKHFRCADGVYLSARQFGTGGVTITHGEPILFRLMACSDRNDPRNCPGKSIVYTEAVLIDETWNPQFCMLQPDADYFNGDGEVMRFVEKELQLNGFNHDDWICINKYPYRDERFFQKKKSEQKIDLDDLWDEYHANNYKEDFKIMSFIQKRHPEMFHKIWENPDESAFFITAQISGELGCALFQVATTCAHAWDNGAEPIFTGPLPTSPIYEHLLSRCTIKEVPAEKIAAKWPEMSYEYTLIPYHPNMRLTGYFPQEKYFAHQRKRLLDLFAPLPDDLSYVRQKYGSLLDHPQTVGVELHYFEQGYPEDKIYPQYGRDYLEKAMSFFPEGTLFIISSNNLEFARKNIPSEMKNIYFLENEPDYINLFFLSRCKHNIISNSSFGWWSAWLNENPDKIVIRPPVWTNFPSHDIFPPEWVTLDTN